ncbi:MAG: hypothetical protein ACK41X_20425 [Pseudorhodoplanes sp.]
MGGLMARQGKLSALYVEVLGAPQQALPGPLFDIASDLAREIVARPLDYRGCQRLEALGVDGRFVAELGAMCAIGAGRVQLSPDGARWEPHGPDARLLLAVAECGALADIIAVSTTHPDQVARRTGFGWCLGFERYEEALAAAVLAERRVSLRIFPDPLEWLRGRARGICVLDWGLALPQLRGLGERVTLECDAGAGARIRALLEIGGLPRVTELPPRASAIAA